MHKGHQKRNTRRGNSHCITLSNGDGSARDGPHVLSSPLSLHQSMHERRNKPATADTSRLSNPGRLQPILIRERNQNVSRNRPSPQNVALPHVPVSQFHNMGVNWGSIGLTRMDGWVQWGSHSNLGKVAVRPCKLPCWESEETPPPLPPFFFRQDTSRIPVRSPDLA